MIKVCLPSFQLCIFSLIVNPLVLGIQPLRTVAQNSSFSTDTRQATGIAPVTIEPEILSEINRVRTNPQGYAQWLEEQKRYYDGIWLKLPGEKPVRTNRGLKALNEAIAFLQEQQPLSPLPESEATAANASDRLENFATSKNIQYISYGRTTPKGIVMSLVVDDLFPDRRRRKSLLSPDADNTGVVCKPDPIYAKVCAIAYSDTPEAETNTITASKPELPEAKAESVDNAETTVENSSENLENESTTAEALPTPPIPQAPPTLEVPDVNTPATETETETETAAEDNQEIEVSQAEVEESEDESDLEEEDTEETEEDEPDLEESESVDNQETEADADAEADADEEADAEADEEEVATNSDSSQILENVERGILEEGDRVIAEDGSFYDSYPLEAESNESFIIYLESEEFDAFVALVDAKGNIVEQNDDIDEENSNSRIKVTIPENGTYNVIVNAYDEGGAGEYVLTIRR